jgi:hypothetical protein
VSDLLKIRIETKFLTIAIRNLLNNDELQANQIINFKNDAFSLYQNALNYLIKWTKQFESFKTFSWMSLSNEPGWEQVSNTIKYLNDKNICIDEEKCLNQFVNLKKFYKEHFSTEIKDIDKKWLQYFKTILVPDKYSEFLKMIQYMFAIPGHNATVERIFSLIEAQWTDERNRLKVENIKYITMVKFNFNFNDCTEFYNCFKNNFELLKKVSNNDKYEYKK